MIDPLVQQLMVGSSIGGAAAYLGSLMITRKMALVGDALGHVALPGMGIALLLNLDPSIGAFAFLAAGILAIWVLEDVTRLTTETLAGVAFVSSLSIGFLIVPQPDLLESLIGDISKLTLSGTFLALLASAITFFVVSRIYGRMMLLSVSEDLAALEGISARNTNLLYLAAIALIVSIGIKVTGSLLVGALVIVPPAMARIITSRLRPYAYTSIALGATSSVVGIFSSQLTHFPVGPSIVLISTLFFLFSLAWKKSRLG